MSTASTVPPKAKKKQSRGKPVGPWITARKVVQYLSLIIFLVLFVLSARGGLAGSLVNFPMRLDPLAMLSHLLASRTFLVGSSLALLTIILTLVFGRAWCGWLCPLGTTLDIFSLKHWRGKRQEPPEAWRSVKYALLLTILVAALFGNLTLLVLDPLTIIFRTLTVSIWPAVDQIVTAVETSLYNIPFMAGTISTVDGMLRPVILPPEPVYYRDAVLFAAVFLGVILLNLAAPRFWCRYLCPLGALLGLISKVSLFRRQVGEDCKGCVLCEKVCPTGTINPEKSYASDPSECTMCLDCLEVCPRSSIAFTPGLKLPNGTPMTPTAARRWWLSARPSLPWRFSAAALLPSGRRRIWSGRRGTRENDLLSKCVRCAECMRACPTGGLQPAVTEAGLEGFWTPVLIPRLGYCDYSCNACGQVCPVQAIPPLALEDKRNQVIGKAYINQNRCLAWSDHIPCIVCEEMCPLPEKAIQLQESQNIDQQGNPITLQLPSVLRERCIGCGICEYKCPVNGEAAIRVYVPGTEVPF